MTDKILAVTDAAIRDLTAATDACLLQERLTHAAAELGFDRFGLAKDVHLDTWKGHSELTSWLPEFTDAYVSCGIASRDPLIKAVRRGRPHLFF